MEPPNSAASDGGVLHSKGRNKPWDGCARERGMATQGCFSQDQASEDDVCSCCRSSSSVLSTKKNFISHFLVVLLIIAGFANNVAFNLSQPSILYKGRKRNS